MSGRPWIKFSTARIDDARLAQISDAAQRDFFMLYLLAGRLDADGTFTENGRQLSDEEIAFKIRIKAARLKASISEMKKARLVHVNGKGPQIPEWEHEQINWREKREQDRERQARHRDVTRDSDGVTRDGEAVTLPDQTRGRGRSRSDKKKNRSNPPPTPPAKQGASVQGGKAGDQKAEPSISSLPQAQMKRAVRAMEILRSSGLRNPRLKTLSVYLATRSYKTNDEFTTTILAALASAYDDPSAKDKAIIAAHRLENDQIPAHYRKPKTWSAIPDEVLKAAKVDRSEIGGSEDRWTIKR